MWQAVIIASKICFLSLSVRKDHEVFIKELVSDLQKNTEIRITFFTATGRFHEVANICVKETVVYRGLCTSPFIFQTVRLSWYHRHSQWYKEESILI